MKRMIAITSAILLTSTLLASCADTTPSSESTSTIQNLLQPTIKQPTSTHPQTQPAPLPTTQPTLPDAPTYDPLIPLFIGGTCDDTLHYVNAYGDVIEEASKLLPYYAENGLASAYSPTTQKMGFIDKEGVFVISPIYDAAGLFSKVGLAPVAIGAENGGRKWGFINEYGQIVIPCEYDEVTAFSEFGYAIVSKYNENGILETGVIDAKGNFCISLSADNQNLTLTEDFVILGSSDVANATGTELRDYTGKVFDTIDDDKYGYFLYTHGTIYKFESELTNGQPTVIYPHYLEDGEYKLVAERYMDVDVIRFDRKQVSTTLTGFGFKLLYKDQSISSYEYDYVTRAYVDSRYILALQYLTADGSSCLVDIYDTFTGEQTANDIEWGWWYTAYSPAPCFDYFPDGYFIVEIYNEAHHTMCYGIVDYTGKYIMEPIYEGIIPYSYDFMMLERYS